MGVYSSGITYLTNSVDGCVRIDSKSNGVIIYQIPHSSATQFTDNYELQQAGIYLLINKEKRTVYIGQADKRSNNKGVLARMIEPHSSEIDSWDFGYSITSNLQGFMLASELNYFERYFYDEANDAQNYKVLNGNRPHATESFPLTVHTKPFIDCVLFLLKEHCRLDIFEKSKTPGTPKDGNSNGRSVVKSSAIDKQFHLKTFVAKSIYTAEGKSLVKAGEPIRGENRLPYQSGQEGNVKLREKLTSDGTIVDNRFVKDYVFNTPSQAASVILGRSANGNTEWLDENEIEFGKYPEAKHKK